MSNKTISFAIRSYLLWLSPVAFQSSPFYVFDLKETGLYEVYERVSLAQIHFFLFLRDTSSTYESSL